MIDREIRLTTERLVLRPTAPGDAARLAQIQSNWNVTKMLRLAPWPTSEAAMFDWVDLHGTEWAAGTAYRFACMNREALIGVCDIDEIADGSGEFGYWFDEAYWGQGFAGEAARAVLVFGLDTVGLTRITAGHAADNGNSGKVLRRLGFRLVGETTKYSMPHGREIPYLMYELSVG
jgi:ribosomal-protein-alanine N-acetyltransferase